MTRTLPSNVVRLPLPPRITMRESSLDWLRRETVVAARYTEESGDPAEQERLRRLDCDGQYILSAVLRILKRPTPEGAARLARYAAALRGEKAPRRGSTWAFSHGLHDAIAIIDGDAPGNTRTENGRERPVDKLDWMHTLQWSRSLRDYRSEVHARLFEGLALEDAHEALVMEYAWLTASEGRAARGVVERLLCAALRRGVRFAGSGLRGTSELKDVRRVVGSLLRRGV